MQHRSHGISGGVSFGVCLVAVQALSDLHTPPEARSAPGNLQEPDRNTPLEVTRETKCVRHLPESLCTAPASNEVLKRVKSRYFFPPWKGRYWGG
jgi:hypothetical protein